MPLIKGELTRENKEIQSTDYKYIDQKEQLCPAIGLGQRINTPQTRDLIRRLNLAAITVLNNENHVLPLHTNQKRNDGIA